ncbi:MAG TPA: radical SAM protein, partial [Gemmatales bacterium]|nr:radical SAM protein [Gemmatales bacterium]
ALDIVKNRSGAVSAPRFVTYLVCYRCNARCKMCDSWRLKPGQELTIPEVRTVFRKLGRLDVVRLTGGEPFLREDFAELAEAVVHTSQPGTLHITTNGSFPKRVEALVRSFSTARRLRFMVSFDGTEAEHDANRGKEVTFQTALETVQRLAALRSSHGIEVSINHTVISEQSLLDHSELMKRFTPMGVDVHMVLAYADSAMYGLKRVGKKAHDLIIPEGYPLHPRLAQADVIGFVQQKLIDVDQMQDRWLRIGKRYYLRGLLQRLQKQKNPSPSPRCVALRSHLRLLPDGRVPVCQFNTETVGNLLTQSLEEIWHGEAARTQRAWVDACTGCWAECEVVPNALYTG